MFIPKHWSEATHVERLAERRQVTIRRFGWASTSQEDADVHARKRVEEALAALRAAGPDGLQEFTRRERAVAYAGSEGLPIREEVLREWPDLDVVLTRNAYGSVCLNTTRALFVDVDPPMSNSAEIGCSGFGIGAILGLAFGLYGSFTGQPIVRIHPAVAVALGMVLGGLISFFLARAWEGRLPRFRDPSAWAIGRVREWCATRPEWRVVAYQTPAGARLLAVHTRFDAADEAAFEFMDFLKADPLYQRMCRLQRCFRARVSPKPWRAGISQHFRAGGTWPVRDPAKLAARREWVARYDQAAISFASCRLVETIGTGRADSEIEAIRRIHDDLSRATMRLPLA